MPGRSNDVYDSIDYREGLDIYEDLGIGTPEGVDCIIAEQTFRQRYTSILVPTTLGSEEDGEE